MHSNRTLAASQDKRLRDIARRNADELARIDYVQARLLAEACGIRHGARPPLPSALSPGVDIAAVHRRAPTLTGEED